MSLEAWFALPNKGGLCVGADSDYQPTPFTWTSHLYVTADDMPHEEGPPGSLSNGDSANLAIVFAEEMASTVKLLTCMDIRKDNISPNVLLQAAANLRAEGKRFVDEIADQLEEAGKNDYWIQIDDQLHGEHEEWPPFDGQANGLHGKSVWESDQ